MPEAISTQERAVPGKPNIQFTRTPGLERNHPCYNCMDAQVMGDKVFCYRPGCRRHYSFDGTDRFRNKCSVIRRGGKRS